MSQAGAVARVFDQDGERLFARRGVVLANCGDMPSARKARLGFVRQFLHRAAGARGLETELNTILRSCARLDVHLEEPR